MGVQTYTLLSAVCFAALNVGRESSAEAAAADEPFEPTGETTLRGGGGALDATDVLERFVTGLDAGRDTSSSRPPYFAHEPQRQKRPQRSRQYHHRPPIERFNYYFGASDGGRYNDPPDTGYYQHQSDGGDNGGFDHAGFTNFAPPVGFRSTATAARPPYSAATPQVHNHMSSAYAAGSSSLYDESATAGGVDGGSYEPSGYGGHDYSPPPVQQQHSPAMQPAMQPAVVHKSIYVHVAPPDDEPPRKQRVVVPRSPPKKNYQIVFIKAPTSPPPAAPIIPPPPPQHADKTLIYVLHPKHEEAPAIHVPPPPAHKPVKPEVYFIKYKHRREEPSHGGADYGGGGGQLPSPGEELGGGGDVGSGGYLHRRYGRNDKKSSETSPPTGGGDSGGGGAMPELREVAASAADAFATIATPAATATDGWPGPADGDADRAEESAAATQREFGDADRGAEEPAAATQREFGDADRAAAATQREFGDADRPEDGENDDASVESSVSQTRYVLMSAVAPKGKNGH